MFDISDETNSELISTWKETGKIIFRMTAEDTKSTVIQKLNIKKTLCEENSDLGFVWKKLNFRKNVWQEASSNSKERNINGTNKELSLSLRQKQNVAQWTRCQQKCME